VQAKSSHAHARHACTHTHTQLSSLVLVELGGSGIEACTHSAVAAARGLGHEVVALVAGGQVLRLECIITIKKILLI
jgi:hypothetical protein